MQPPPRITLVQTTYYTVADSTPLQASVRFNQILTSGEQGYTRILLIPEEWTRLEFGWIPKPFAAVLRNDQEAGSPTQLLLSLGDDHESDERPFACIPPQAGLSWFLPPDPVHYYVKAVGGPCVVCLYGVPQ